VPVSEPEPPSPGAGEVEVIDLSRPAGSFPFLPQSLQELNVKLKANKIKLAVRSVNILLFTSTTPPLRLIFVFNIAFISIYFSGFISS
jgi:hypothetical protein